MASPQNHCRGYLPHIEVRKLQFITFRLYDSLPSDVILQYKSMSDYLKTIKEPTEQDKTRQRQLLKIIDKYEDAGYGQCFFKDNMIAAIVQDTLLKHDGKEYNLLEWCIMPNHVHVLINILGDFTLSQILHSWRSYIAHEANKQLNRTGVFWMHEYFDRYIRDHNHYCRVVNYIAKNPVKAGLVNAPEEWRWRGSTAVTTW